jgi:inner membrane protein
VLELNRNYSEAWQAGDVTPDALVQSRFGTELFQSVDAYQRTERAIKYALLFIALTFMTFFAWEQVSGTKLHPLQYLLVGLALSTFYLLLLALSEHLSFWGAYAIAAGALVALITVYVSGVVDPRRGSIVGGAIAVIYALLYVLIRSEDYALLIGSIVLFAVLAIVMISTRRVQWYALAAASDE